LKGGGWIEKVIYYLYIREFVEPEVKVKHREETSPPATRETTKTADHGT